MRYEIRFTNGVYHIFDTHTYRAVRAVGLRKQAESGVHYFNTRPARSPS